MVAEVALGCHALAGTAFRVALSPRLLQGGGLRVHPHGIGSAVRCGMACCRALQCMQCGEGLHLHPEDAW